MNILITVLSFLMVLTLVTYARLETFRALSGTRIEFEKYMEKTERAVANALNENKYNTTISKKGGGSKPQNKVEGSPRLSWYAFIHPSKQSDPNLFATLKNLNIQLIQHLYGKNKEFEEILQKSPQILHDLFDRIGPAAEAQESKIKVTKVSDLANIELGNPQLDHLLYLLFEGYTIPENPSQVQMEEEETEERADESDIEDQLQQDAYDFRSASGHISLLDYITAQNTNKIRVFLAPPPVLYAIFGDVNTVNQIMASRVELYLEVMKGVDKQEASNMFKQNFQASALKDYAPLLNYDVTKVDPRIYH